MAKGKWHQHDGLTAFSDIAKEMGTSTQYVHLLYQNAMRKLRKQFATNPDLAQDFKDAVYDPPESPGEVFETDRFFPKVWEWDEHQWEGRPNPYRAFFFGRGLVHRRGPRRPKR